MTEGIVTEVSNEIGRVFRHLLPGVLILAAAQASHPPWFSHGVDISQPWHVAVLAAIALAVGNAWYVVHRYIVDQLLDVMAFYFGRGTCSKPYMKWLPLHVQKSYQQASNGVRDHLPARAAQMIYLGIVAEVVLFFAVTPASGSFFSRNQKGLIAVGLLLFAGFVWQYYICFRIDVDTAQSLTE